MRNAVMAMMLIFEVAFTSLSAPLAALRPNRYLAASVFTLSFIIAIIITSAAE